MDRKLKTRATKAKGGCLVGAKQRKPKGGCKVGNKGVGKEEVKPRTRKPKLVPVRPAPAVPKKKAAPKKQKFNVRTLAQKEKMKSVAKVAAKKGKRIMKGKTGGLKPAAAGVAKSKAEKKARIQKKVRELGKSMIAKKKAAGLEERIIRGVAGVDRKGFRNTVEKVPNPETGGFDYNDPSRKPKKGVTVEESRAAARITPPKPKAKTFKQFLVDNEREFDDIEYEYADSRDKDSHTAAQTRAILKAAKAQATKEMRAKYDAAKPAKAKAPPKPKAKDTREFGVHTDEANAFMKRFQKFKKIEEFKGEPTKTFGKILKKMGKGKNKLTEKQIDSFGFSWTAKQLSLFDEMMGKRFD